MKSLLLLVILNGQPMNFERNQPYFQNYRGNIVLMVPVRAVIEGLGGTVNFRWSTSPAVFTYNGKTVSTDKEQQYLTSGDSPPYLFDYEKGPRASLAPLKLEKGVMFLPLRSLAEMLGFSLQWNAEKKIAYVSY